MREVAFPPLPGQSKLGAVPLKVDRALRRAMFLLPGFAGTLSSSAERSIHLRPKDLRNFRNLSGLFQSQHARLSRGLTK
jgi:hypothetical protein